MNKPLPISCFIIAENESDRIGKTIRSVSGLVEEIIVVDSGSSDGTQKIAEELGAKVFFNDWKGYGPQKRFGEECCNNNWILNLDADEYLSDDIKNEIYEIFQDYQPKFYFYSLKVVPIYPNWSRPRLLSAHHKCVRLYNKNYGRFSDSPVHDSVQVAQHQVKSLKEPVFHNSVRSIKHLIEKENNYIMLQSLTLKGKNKFLLFIRLFTELPFAFFKYYVIRRHFTGAFSGLITACILAYFRWKRIFVLFKKN